MTNENLQPCAYRILRYTPNLIRDEFINVGVVLFDPARRQARVRLIEDAAEFARLRRLHPNADEGVLRALGQDFEAQFAAHADDPEGWLRKLEDTMSNVLQLGPQRGVLAEDWEGELDRLFSSHVEAPRFRVSAAEASTRTGLRMKMRATFRSAGILDRLTPGFRVDGFTSRGDPLRLDYAYAKNGTRGFIHALALNRDPGQAKVLAFTAERVRAKLASADFTAITEIEPQPKNDRHAFVAGLLADQNVDLVPVAQLPSWTSQLGASLH